MSKGHYQKLLLGLRCYIMNCRKVLLLLRNYQHRHIDLECLDLPYSLPVEERRTEGYHIAMSKGHYQKPKQQRLWSTSCLKVVLRKIGYWMTHKSQEQVFLKNIVRHCLRVFLYISI